MEISELVFDLNNYANEGEMWKDITAVMATLSHNNYECVFRYEDCGNYWLRWAPADGKYGGPRIEFLNEKEAAMLHNYRYDQEIPWAYPECT